MKFLVTPPCLLFNPGHLRDSPWGRGSWRLIFSCAESLDNEQDADDDTHFVRGCYSGEQ